MLDGDKCYGKKKAQGRRGEVRNPKDRWEVGSLQY